MKPHSCQCYSDQLSQDHKDQLSLVNTRVRVSVHKWLPASRLRLSLMGVCDEILGGACVGTDFVLREAAFNLIRPCECRGTS